MGVIGATSELMTSLAAKWDLLLPSKKCQVKQLICSFLWIKLSSWLIFYSRGVFQVNHDHPLSPTWVKYHPRSPSFFYTPHFLCSHLKKNTNNKTEMMFFLSAGSWRWSLGRWLRYTVAQNKTRVKSALQKMPRSWASSILRSLVLPWSQFPFGVYFLGCCDISSSLFISPCCVSVLSGLHVSVSGCVSCFSLKVLRLVWCSSLLPLVGQQILFSCVTRCLHSVLCFLTESQVTSLFLHLSPDRKTACFFNIFQYFKCESLSNMIMKMRL